MFNLHHIGYTVADMSASIRQFATFGYQAGAVLHDQALQVDICYLTRKDAVTVDTIEDAILVLHIIVHGIWDDKIRELTLPLIPEICKKWGIEYKILADYFDLQKSIEHHNLPTN